MLIGMYGTGYLANSYTVTYTVMFFSFFLSLNRCRSFVQSNLCKLLLVLVAINIGMNL